MINTGVHRTHCCYTHGCKYGDGADCPVESGKIMGLYKCESCLDEEEDPRHQEIKRLKEENAALKAKIKSLEEGHELCSQYECDHYKMDHNENGCQATLELEMGYARCPCKGFKNAL